jgi:hypothetical protein
MKKHLKVGKMKFDMVKEKSLKKGYIDMKIIEQIIEEDKELLKALAKR